MRKSLFLVALFLIATLSFNGVAAQNIAQGVRVVVIDAGHGGPKFPGAHYRGVYEKDLNLQIALKLGALIEKELPQLKVVYTRKTDKQFSESLTQDLQARADIANKAGGDLFISIHTNAAASASARGVETLIMGESPLEKNANERALYYNNQEELLDMSNEKTAAIVRAYIQNLQFTYGEYSEAMARLVQKHYVKSGRHNRGVKRQPLKVLYATDMPGILTEIGFLSNSEEYAYPNPVRPEYWDKVTITRLMDNSIVKITDLNGNLVYQTKSLGGQVIWNCRNTKGVRVASGVYLVLSATEDSKESVVTKIAVIK